MGKIKNEKVLKTMTKQIIKKVKKKQKKIDFSDVLFHQHFLF